MNTRMMILILGVVCFAGIILLASLGKDVPAIVTGGATACIGLLVNVPPDKKDDDAAAK